MIFNVWDSRAENPVMDAVIVALERRYPSHPSWFLERTPMGYSDQTVIRADLRAGGFTDCAIETVALTGLAPNPDGPAEGLCYGTPLREEIEALDPDGLAAATQAAAAAIVERCGADAFKTKLQALVIVTQKQTNLR